MESLPSTSTTWTGLRSEGSSCVSGESGEPACSGTDSVDSSSSRGSVRSTLSGEWNSDVDVFPENPVNERELTGDRESTDSSNSTCSVQSALSGEWNSDELDDEQMASVAADGFPENPVPSDDGEDLLGSLAAAAMSDEMHGTSSTKIAGTNPYLASRGFSPPTEPIIVDERVTGPHGGEDAASGAGAATVAGAGAGAGAATISNFALSF